ncbi:head GIN domain-containing protein [Sphingomonas sp. ID0503]|uniref:head GIN domain-containing protein n=1 Tax=Sphingomonas sp. ID0503 TaxID=3399691 RepID=UPI003AFAD140
MRLALLLAPVLLLGACDKLDATKMVRDTGPDITQTFPATGFNGVELRGPESVTVKTGPAFSVTAKGPRRAVEGIDIQVQGGLLRVGRKEGRMSYSGRGAEITVTMPAIATALISGPGSLDIDKVRGDSFALALTGAGSAEVGEVAVRTAEMSITGAGSVEAAGSAQTTTLMLKGVGSFDLDKFTTRDLKVSLRGTGSIDVRATGTATGEAAGVGSVSVAGGAKCSIARRGMGSVECT